MPPASEMPSPASAARAELAASIEATLRAEALRNEKTIAGVRTAGMALIAAADVLMWLSPPGGPGTYPGSIPALTAGWAVLSLGILFALRRGYYRGWMRVALPFADAAATATILWNAMRAMGLAQYLALGSLANVGAVTAIIAVSGALRLTRNAAALTAGLAVAVFVGVEALAGVVTAQTLVGVALLVATGLLGMRIAGVVRRAVSSEVARMTLRRFLPERVVAEAHHDPLALLTEPRLLEATVLVSDLRGFTAMSEAMAPAEVLAFLNGLQGSLAAAVRAHGGTVDKFMGDGMLAVFGAPEPLPEHASHALRAARDMVDAVRRLNAGRALRGEAPVRIGIGLHAGPVVTGCLGSGARLEFTVIGDTVNAASRLEALTKEKKVPVLASAEVVRRAGGERGAPVAVAAAGEVVLRGRTEPLGVFALDEEVSQTAPPLRA